MPGIIEYAYAGIAAAILGGWIYYDGKVSSLENEVAVLERKLVVAGVNSTTLKATIKETNARIAKQQINLDKRNKELDEWKHKPVKVRYKTIYKHIPQWVDVRREDCETTKSVIDAARHTDFNGM